MISIKKYRGLRAMNQVQLAEALGVSRQYLCALESKKMKVPVNQVKKIAAVLQISPVELYGLENFKIKPETREEKEFLIKALQESLEE